MNATKDVPEVRIDLLTLALLVQVAAAVIVHLAIQLARRAYDIVIPGQELPRLTEIVRYSVWLFFGMIAPLAVIASLRRLRAHVLAAFLLLDVCALLAVLWGILLPFGLMAR